MRKRIMILALVLLSFLLIAGCAKSTGENEVNEELNGKDFKLFNNRRFDPEDGLTYKLYFLPNSRVVMQYEQMFSESKKNEDAKR